MTFHSEKVQPTKDELLQILNKKFCEVKKIPISEAQNFAGLIRSTLEWAVQYFYKAKYDEIPVWDKGDFMRATFNLNDAINDARFRNNFDQFILSDMHNIKKLCNDILHNPTASLSVDTAGDMLERLEKCIRRIESALQEKIIFTPIVDGGKPHPDEENTDKTYSNENENSGNEPTEGTSTKDGGSSKDNTFYLHQYPGCNPEQNLFWNMLQRVIDENGNPFTFSPRQHYAAINRKNPNSNLCLSFDFLLQKQFLRVGIYIADDNKTPQFEYLLAHKSEIEQELGFAPIWTNRGSRNPNARRIETRIPFIPYDHDDYARLIEALLPVTVKYIEVFSKYLPAILKDGSREKEKAHVGEFLVYDLQHSYGMRAQDIYDACCERFGWDASKRHLFGIRMWLYAEGASPEGYSPWFIAHSNWTEDKGGHWRNTIYHDRIEEIWERPNDNMNRDMTERIVFAKHPAYGYVFLGVFKPSAPQMKISPEGKTIWFKTYTSTASIYPWKKLNRIHRRIRLKRLGIDIDSLD